MWQETTIYDSYCSFVCRGFLKISTLRLECNDTKAVNQRYWLEYHPITANSEPLCQRTTHLLRPSADSPNYAHTQGLRPLHQWACLTNSDTFIYGPFKTSIVNNCKSRDRISQENWKTLHNFGHLFTSQAPLLDLPAYFVYFDHFHTTYVSDAHSTRVTAILATPSSPLLV